MRSFVKFDGRANKMKISLKIQAGAKKESLEKQSDTWRLKISAPPIEGRGNQRVREILAQIFEVPISKVDIIRGEKSKQKIFELPGNLRPEEIEIIFSRASWK